MRILKWLAVSLILLLVALRVAAPFLIKRKLNQLLNTIPDYYGSVDSVHLAVWRGGMTVGDIQITTVDQNLALTVKAVSLHWKWLPLFRRMVVAEVFVQSPRARLLVPKPSEAGAVVKKETAIAKNEMPPPAKPKPSANNLPDQLSAMIPFRINRFVVSDGTVRLRDTSGTFSQQAARDKTEPAGAGQVEGGRELLIQKINIDVDNITNTRKDTGTKWAKGRVTAVIQESGEMLLNLEFNPTARQPFFDLNFRIQHLDLTQLNPIFQWQTGLDVKQGLFELYSEAASADGRFEGYVKPFIEDFKALDISKDKKQGIGKVIKQAVIGAVVFVFKNHKRNEMSTKVPFSGQFENPKVGIWEAVVEVLRNAFIKALYPQLDHSVSLHSVIEKK